MKRLHLSLCVRALAAMWLLPACGDSGVASTGGATEAASSTGSAMTTSGTPTTTNDSSVPMTGGSMGMTGEPTSGGVVQTLAEDVVSFQVSYLDPALGEWVDSWDSTQPTGQFERLPRQVRVELVLGRGPDGGTPYRFVTKVPIAMQSPLMFGVTP